MKKLFLLTAAFATMLFASCEKEEMAPVAKETTVTYTVELPSVQTKAGTKAIGDGFNVDQLVYEVWKTEAANERDLKDGAKATRLYQETVSMSKTDGEQKCVVTLNLVHDQNYTILFWAQNDAADAYNTDVLTNVYYAKDKYLSNNEDMAAFYGVEFLEAEEIEKSGPMRRTELKRPFAQLNIATMNTVDANEYKVQLNKSKVKFTKVPTVFDVAQNTPTTPAVTGDVEFTFDYAALPEEVLSVNGKAYDHYVAMNYIFAPNGEGDVTVEYWIDATLKPTDVANGKVETPATINNTVINVPLKENYRTNIVGNLLTSTTQYEVVIDARWDDVYDADWDGRVEEVWDQKYIQEPPVVNGAYEISLASELSWLAAQVNANAQTFSGITFKLVEDIDLKDPNFIGASDLIWNPIGANGKFKGTFDGQGHIISNLVVRTNGTTPAGLFGRVESGTVKNVKVVNADVQGHGSAAVVVAHGVCAKISDCHVENATVISTTRNNDDANNVGGIIGYLSGESVGYVKGCSVKNSTIKGYRDVAGIAGTANQTAEVSGNTVSNITVIADQTAEYKENKAQNVGAVAGRIHANANVSGNTVGDNVVVYTLVGNSAQLQNALNFVVAGENDIRFARNISGNVVAEQNEGKNIIINGNDKKLYGKITIDGNSRHDGAETLLIKNIKFETTADALEFIEQNSTDGAIRYPHNVTIENCTFKGGDNVIATKLRQGYNISIIDSKVISGHSLAQLYGCTGVTIDGVEVNAGRGISFGTSTNLSVKESSFNVDSYGLRADGTVATALKIENTSIAAEKPVIVRELKAAYGVEFTGNNTLTTSEDYQVILTNGDDDEAYTTPTGDFSLTGAENFKVYFGDSVNSAKTLDLAINTIYGDEINVEAKIESIGTGFEVKRDVTFDFQGYELNAGSTASSTWYALEISGDNDVVIKNANFTRAGISASNGANVVFENGTINHKPERTSRYIFSAQSGATIIVKEGTFKNDRAKNSFFWANNATIIIEGGNFGGVASNNKVYLSNGGQVIIKGGTFNFDPTAYLAEGYQAVKSGSTWTVSAI